MPLDTQPVSGATQTPNQPSSPATPATQPTGTGDSLPTQGTPVTPVSPAPAAATGTTAGTPAASGTPAGDPAAGAPATPATPAPLSWLENLRKQGVDLGNDEAAALSQIATLRQTFDQIQPLTPYLSAYTRHAPQFHQWLQTQNQTQQQAKPEDPWHKEFWNPPEYNPQWAEQYVITGADGKRAWATNTPPEIIAKTEAYLSYQRDQMTKLQQNPFAFFEGAMQKMTRREAEKIVSENLSKQREQQGSQQFIAQNRGWLYEKGPDGSMLQAQQFNPMTGQYYQAPVLSQWGQAFGRYVSDIARQQSERGYSDVSEQQRLATMMVERDYAIALYSGKASGQGGQAPAAAPQVTGQQAANNQFLQNNNPPAAQPPVNGNSRFQEAVFPKNVHEFEQMGLAQLRALGINN